MTLIPFARLMTTQIIQFSFLIKTTAKSKLKHQLEVAITSIFLFRYFVCFNGSPVSRSCADSLWWDIINEWCTVADDVTCDDRTVNNPNNPSETTTVVTIPTEPPILSDCYKTNHLFSPVDGSYMKSSCIVNSIINYEQAEATCQQHNMNLFIINDSVVQSAFLTATTNDLLLYVNGFVWINGRRESDNEWVTFSPARAPLYEGISWVQTENVDGRTSGDCLRYSSVHGPYEAMGVTCEATSWFTCEFFSEPTLNTDSCWHEASLIDDDGSYLKTSCIVSTGYSHWEAEQACLHNGMRLFVINNSTVQAAFFKSTTEALLDNPGGFLWINGKRNNDEWFSYGPERLPLYDGIDWVQTDTENGRTSGDCLLYTQHLGPFQAMGADCAARVWSICEY